MARKAASSVRSSPRNAAGCGPRCGGFFENGSDSFAFVAACAQFEASLEFEQAKAVHLRKRLKKNARLLHDHSGASRRSTAPVHDDGIRFFLNQSAAQAGRCVTP